VWPSGVRNILYFFWVLKAIFGHRDLDKWRED
jgi:hypothetical protein